MQELIGVFVSYLYIGALLLSGAFISKNNNEFSRKYVHILSANWWFIAMYFFEPSSIWVWIIPITFILTNYLSYRFKIFKAIETTENRGLGTVYYAISIFLLAILSFTILKQPIIGAFGVLIMGYGDGLAALIGQRIPSDFWYKNKSITGSLTMFFVTFIVIFVLLTFLNHSATLIASLVIAVVATLTEAYGKSGWDNIIVPLSVSTVAALFIYFI